jgi:hypothetical protein
MVAVRPLHRGWKTALTDLIGSAQQELVVAAPFITAGGTQVVAEHLSASVREQGRVQMVTDLSPAHVCDGSLDTDALATLCDTHSSCAIWHVPALHAKVYIADCVRAIVTSGNLTDGAFYRNAEYGVEITDRGLVNQIRHDIADFQAIGAPVSAASMRSYAAAARTVRESFERQRTRVDPALKRAFDNAIRTAETELIRLRLAGGAMHTVFAKTLLVLLAREGPLSTPAIHGLVHQLHPDLCDDSVERVIDGKSFGKKWKHAVRTAQQQLKKRGLIAHDGTLWKLTT